MNITAYQLAQRFVGISEVPGKADNPLILSMLQLDEDWPTDDEVPWCSAFCNFVCWLLRLPRSKSLRARSWLQVGTPYDLQDAIISYDVVIFSRGRAPQPGPSVIAAPGHVGFYAGIESNTILVLGGNQSDKVCVHPYPATRLLGVRRLWED